MVGMTISALGARRGHSWLFRRLDFKVESGYMLWIRGANGAGKTTLLRILAGLGESDEGSVNVQDIGAEAKTGATLPLYIGHSNGLKDDLTVLESLRFLAQLHRQNADPQDLEQALLRLGMHHRRRAFVRTLSQGQRRRVALARLSLEPEKKIWVLDEPFDALDAQGIQTVSAMMCQHVDSGGSIAYTSHIDVDIPLERRQELHLGDN